VKLRVNFRRIQNTNFVGLQGIVLGVDGSQAGKPATPSSLPQTAWQINHLDGTRFTNTGNWVANEYVFAGQKLASSSTDYLSSNRDATRNTWGGASSEGSVAGAATGAFFGSIGNSIHRFGSNLVNGVAQMGANVIDTLMILGNAGTNLAGLSWQYQAIGQMGQAVEAGEISTAGIAWNVAKGLGMSALDVGSLGILPSVQYAMGYITAEEAGDRLIGVGMSAIGGIGTLRAAGLASMTIGQAGKAAVGATRNFAANIKSVLASSSGFKTFMGGPVYSGPRLTGIQSFDDFAEGTKAFARFSAKLEKAGIALKKVTFGKYDDTIAQFNKGVFEYDPSRFRVLNLLHENRHLSQFSGLRRAGSDWNKTTSKLSAVLETEAYNFELSLAKRFGFSSEFVERTTKLRDGYFWKWNSRYHNSDRFSNFSDRVFGYRPGRD
jgi:hypothetical protein